MAQGEFIKALMTYRRQRMGMARPPRGQRAPILKSMLQGALQAGQATIADRLDTGGLADGLDAPAMPQTPNPGWGNGGMDVTRFGSLQEMRRRPFGPPEQTRPRGALPRVLNRIALRQRRGLY